MTARTILVPAASHSRVADRLAALEHDLNVVLWSTDGLTMPNGGGVDSATIAPEVAWITIDLFLTGDFLAFVDAALAFNSVKWFQACLAGTDAPPFARILDSGARLSNSDSPNAGVAEYVMGSVLHLVHDINTRVEQHREQEWVQLPWREINGMTWVIVGFGSIGHEIAQRARGFGVEVVGVRRTAVADASADRMATMDQLHNELAMADVVILACPLTEETTGLADAAFFGAMKPGSILVNVSRGPVVDTPALLAALDEGTPSEAILDVFDTEPLPDDSPIWTHPKVFMTSHIAGAGAGIITRGDALFIEQLDDYLSDRPLRLEVT
ncbi:MAG: phosphoglycerate dehydrogenase-like enzyme [Candidatus Poriferisodalaceae bacterium]|jgi:phosphoglycerate dehydrogenase-like enzyme